MTRNRNTDDRARSNASLNDDALEAVQGGYPENRPRYASIMRAIGHLIPDGLIPLPEPIAPGTPATPVVPLPRPVPPCPPRFQIHDADLAAVGGGFSRPVSDKVDPIRDQIWPQLPLPKPGVCDLPPVDSTWLTPEDVLPSKPAQER